MYRARDTKLDRDVALKVLPLIKGRVPAHTSQRTGGRAIPATDVWKDGFIVEWSDYIIA